MELHDTLENTNEMENLLIYSYIYYTFSQWHLNIKKSINHNLESIIFSNILFKKSAN